MQSLRHNSLVVVLSGLLLGVTAGARGQDSQQPASQNQQNQGQQNQGQTTPQGQQNQEQPATPIPAYRSPLASAAGAQDEDQGPQPLTPDTTPLSGALNVGLGNLQNDHSYWQPHVDISGSVDSNPQEGPNSTNWSTWTSISGGLDLHRISGNSDLTLSYLGGGMIATGGQASSGALQQLGVIEKLSLRRWTLSFVDQLSYLPGSALAFGGLDGVGLGEGGSVGLGSSFGLPGQTNLTGLGQSLANAFTTEADVNLTPRTSLTFVGGYTVLDYPDSSLLNSTGANFRGGYNYLLTRKDTVAVFYTYSGIRYGNFDQSIDVHTIQGSYARRVTGKLAFQIAAGPQIAMFRTPIPNSSGSSGGGTTSTSSSRELYWSLSANLDYQLRRTGFNLSYNHGVNGGTGLLGGSVGDIVAGSITHQMSRTFSSGISAGYSRNFGLAIGALPVSQTYNYWFAGATFTHPVGRTLGLTFAYQMQYQDSNSSFCFGPTCGTSVIRHVISFGIGWHERPLLF